MSIMLRFEFEARYPEGSYEGYREGALNKMRMDDAVLHGQLKAIMARFTPEEISAGYLADAAENRARGWSNE